jgi:hypothetical protein
MIDLRVGQSKVSFATPAVGTERASSPSSSSDVVVIPATGKNRIAVPDMRETAVSLRDDRGADVAAPCRTCGMEIGDRFDATSSVPELVSLDGGAIAPIGTRARQIAGGDSSAELVPIGTRARQIAGGDSSAELVPIGTRADQMLNFESSEVHTSALPELVAAADGVRPASTVRSSFFLSKRHAPHVFFFLLDRMQMAQYSYFVHLMREHARWPRRVAHSGPVVALAMTNDAFEREITLSKAGTKVGENFVRCRRDSRFPPQTTIRTIIESTKTPDMGAIFAAQHIGPISDRAMGNPVGFVAGIRRARSLRLATGPASKPCMFTFTTSDATADPVVIVETADGKRRDANLFRMDEFPDTLFVGINDPLL